MANILIKLLAFYQGAISPYFGFRCRYVPSCSTYMKEAIEQRGVLRGLCLGLIRFLRCAPWFGSGFDPVPPLSKTK